MTEKDEFVVDRHANSLRKRIQDGDFGTNGIIPSTTKLAEEWETSRSIVTQVMLLLRSQGHIRPDRKRYKVNHPVLELEGLTENFERYLKSKGLEPVIENVIEPRMEGMPPEIAALFGLRAGIHVVHRMRRQGILEQPLRLAENWYPAELAGEFVGEMRRNDHMDVVGAIKQKHGLYIVKVKEKTRSRVPDTEEIKLLNLARYQPVDEVQRVNIAQDGKTIIMLNRIILVATNFVLSREYEVDHWK